MKNVSFDLSEIDGNAFAILAAFKRQAKREGWTEEEINKVVSEATSGDYQHLLQTIISYTR